MLSTVIFWFGWFSKAFSTMPGFLGNNRAGVLLTCVGAIFFGLRKLLVSEEFHNAPNKLRVFGGFLMENWKSSLRFWAYILVFFWIGHTLDLVYRNADELSTQNHKLTQTNSANVSTCDLEKGDLRVAQATEHSRAETLSKQTIDQLSTINNCQTQAIKLLSPQPLLIETVESGVLLPYGYGGKKMILTFIGITNKEISPVDVTLSCNTDVQLLASNDGTTRLPSLGDSPVLSSIQINKIDSHSIHMHIGSPAWTPNHPLLYPVIAQGDNTECKFIRN